MRGRTKIAIVLALAGLIAAATPVLASSKSPGLKPITGYTGKVENRVLSDTANGREASVMIHLTQQADVSAAYGMKDQDARGWYVYRTLKREADRTQAPSADAAGAGRLVQVLLGGERDRRQGRRPQSRRTRWPPGPTSSSSSRTTLELADGRHGRPRRLLLRLGLDDRSSRSSEPNVVEPGVTQVKAPNVWSLGFNGTGIVVGNQDTGMRWTHNALKPHYRGWNGSTADHNYNWYDAIHSGGGICTPNHQEPCDDDSHGTHTTGTTVGDDGAGNQIGVAPGAKWIGCRNMDQGNGTPATYTECFQFFMAPTDLNGQNPNPALRPHVMNNSWGCPPSEGCAADTLQTIVNNTTAAGIFVEVSAGNAGPSCSTVNDPPAIYAASYSTGALTTGTNSVVGFSSRGPVTVDGSSRIKPDIVAPGTSTRSSTNSGDTATRTSAAPRWPARTWSASSRSSGRRFRA